MGRGAGVMLQGQGTRPERAETAAAAAEAGGRRRPNPLKMKAEKLFWIGNRRQQLKIRRIYSKLPSKKEICSFV
jgi:hypothetical protein